MTEDEMYDIIRGYEESERDYHERNIELENENAKLRELVVRIWNAARLMDANRQIDGMRVTDDLRAECEIAFNKLGIEFSHE